VGAKKVVGGGGGTSTRSTSPSSGTLGGEKKEKKLATGSVLVMGLLALPPLPGLAFFFITYTEIRCLVSSSFSLVLKPVLKTLFVLQPGHLQL